MIPKIGARVRVTGIQPNDPDPMPIGATGTVEGIGPEIGGRTQIWVEWDPEFKRSLMLLDDDPFEVIP